MTEQYLEYPEPLEWQQDLLVKSRELLYQSYPPTFASATTLESTVNRLVLRNGPQTEHNLYFIVEDSSAGVLMRTVHTKCTEFKERIVKDNYAIICGGIDRARAHYQVRLEPKQHNVKIGIPAHDTHALVDDIYRHGTYLTYESARSWENCIDSITEMRNLASDSSGRVTRSLGRMLSRLTGVQ